jgi:hypothetical protein
MSDMVGKYSVSRLDEIQIRANNRLPLQSSQTQTVFNSTENRYIYLEILFSGDFIF